MWSISPDKDQVAGICTLYTASRGTVHTESFQACLISPKSPQDDHTVARYVMQ